MSSSSNTDQLMYKFLKQLETPEGIRKLRESMELIQERTPFTELQEGIHDLLVAYGESYD